MKSEHMKQSAIITAAVMEVLVQILAVNMANGKKYAAPPRTDSFDSVRERAYHRRNTTRGMSSSWKGWR